MKSYFEGQKNQRLFQFICSAFHHLQVTAKAVKDEQVCKRFPLSSSIICQLTT